MRCYDYICPRCGLTWLGREPRGESCECGAKGKRRFSVNVNFHPTKGKR